MTIPLSVEIRAVIRNHYDSLIINLNEINQTWAFVNKNTPFSNTRKPDLIKTLKFVKLLLKVLQFLGLGNVKNENETDAASAI